MEFSKYTSRLKGMRSVMECGVPLFLSFPLDSRCFNSEVRYACNISSSTVAIFNINPSKKPKTKGRKQKCKAFSYSRKLGKYNTKRTSQQYPPTLSTFIFQTPSPNPHPSPPKKHICQVCCSLIKVDSSSFFFLIRASSCPTLSTQDQPMQNFTNFTAPSRLDRIPPMIGKSYRNILREQALSMA